VEVGDDERRRREENGPVEERHVEHDPRVGSDGQKPRGRAEPTAPFYRRRPSGGV
jgi:hypothetical protein